MDRKASARAFRIGASGVAGWSGSTLTSLHVVSPLSTVAPAAISVDKGCDMSSVQIISVGDKIAVDGTRQFDRELDWPIEVAPIWDWLTSWIVAVRSQPTDRENGEEDETNIDAALKAKIGGTGSR